MITQITNRSTLPAPVKAFVIRAVVLLAGWILIYHVLLKPHRVPDRWLSNATASATAGLLSIWYAPASSLEHVGYSSVIMNGRSVIRIADPCNALDLMALYVAFIICMPSPLKRMTAWSMAGIVVIFVLNVLRCNALTWISLTYNPWLDFAHKYLFTAIVYCFIFSLWILYLKKYRH